MQDASYQDNSVSTSFGTCCLIFCVTVAILLFIIQVAMNSCVSLGVTLKEEAIASLVLKYGTDANALESVCENIFLVQADYWFVILALCALSAIQYNMFFKKFNKDGVKALNNQDRLTMMCVVSEIMAEDRVEELRLELQALQSQIQARSEAQTVDAQAPVIEQTVANEENATTPKRARKSATTSQTKGDKS